jgi:hypothetical protein
MSRIVSFLTLVSVVLVFSCSSLFADGRLGVRGGFYTDADEVFVGGEFINRISPRVYFNPNVEYIFVDGGTLMTFNGDFHYDFPVGSRNYVWAGAGLGVSYIKPDGAGDSETEPGLNLLFGIGFPSGNVSPYFQMKLITGDVDDLVLTFGLRF